MKEKRLLTEAVVGSVALMLILLFLMQANPPNAPNETQSLSVLKSETESKYIVSYPNGSIVFSSSEALEAIQSAIDNASSGTVIDLGPGDFAINGTIMLKSNLTLSGNQTVLTNGTISLHDSSNVSLSGLSMNGGGVEIQASTQNLSDVNLKSITIKNCSVPSFVLDAEGQQLSNVQMTDCQAIDGESTGFLLKGSGGNSTISDVELDSCLAMNCGTNSTSGQFASGFYFDENLTLEHLNLTRCESNGSWESGFYFSEASNKSDVMLYQCIANRNGLNPDLSMGCGFYLDESIVLQDCTGEGNLPALFNGTEDPIAPAEEPAIEEPAVEPSVEEPASSVMIAETSVGYSLDSTSILAGNNLHGFGMLSEASDSGNQPMVGAQVGVSIVLPDGTSASPVQGSQATTDANGAFDLDYAPSASGTYQLLLSYAGDETHSPSSSSVSFSATTPATQPPAEAPAQPPTQPSTPSSTTGYTYKVLPDGRVFDINGAQVHAGEVTSSINWALSQGSVVVFLPAGTYNLANQANIDMRSGTTLCGEGDSTVLNFVTKSLIYLYNVDNVALKQFKIIGNGEVYVHITSGTHGNYLFQDVTSYQAPLSCDSAFHIWMTGGGNVDGVRYIRCKAIEPKTHGFTTNGDESGHWARNMYYEDCVASYCGALGTNNQWACGFMLAENINVDGLTVIRCVADHNYESGFHIEVDCLVYNAVFQSCSASYNGIHKPNVVYGFGFLVGGESQQSRISGLNTCTGTGNAGGLIFYGPGV